MTGGGQGKRGQSNRNSKFRRRSVLKGLAASPLVGILGVMPASGQSKTTITLDQPGQEPIEVTPIQTNQPVEDFYSYGSPDRASANTPSSFEQSDTSQLFFHQDQDGRLSLVIIHDEPRDGSGGNVRFDFSGMPSAGDWAVKDDNEFDGIGNVEWNWAPCCTDGGAYRGGFGPNVEMTITPSFIGGIGDWIVRSGDGTGPHALDMASAVNIRIGSESLQSIRETKLDLAGRIDENSLGRMQDKAQVEPVLDELVTSAENNEVDERVVREAMQRMVAGEELTDTVLAGVGPGDSPHLSNETNLSRFTTEYAVNPILELIFAGISFVKLAGAIPGLGGLADDAARWIARFIADLAGYFSETLEQIIRIRAREAGISILEGVEEATKERRGTIAAEEFRDIRNQTGTPFIENSSEAIFNDMLFNEERNFWGNPTEPLDRSVERLIEGLSPNPDEPNLRGGTSAAIDAAKQQLEETNADLEEIDHALSDSLIAMFLRHIGVLQGVLTAIAVAGGVLGYFAVLGAIGTIAGAAAALVGFGVGTLASMIQWGTGAGGILKQRYQHQLVIDQILEPNGG